MDEKLEALKKTTLFAGLKKKELEAIGQITDRTPVAAGRKLINEGQVTTHMYVLIDGSATVDVGGNEVATLGPGDVIGELSMIDDKPASASVTVAEDSHVWLIARGGFTPVWDKNPEMSRSILIGVVEKLRHADELLHG